MPGALELSAGVRETACEVLRAQVRSFLNEEQPEGVGHRSATAGCRRPNAWMAPRGTTVPSRRASVLPCTPTTVLSSVTRVPSLLAAPVRPPLLGLDGSRVTAWFGGRGTTSMTPPLPVSLGTPTGHREMRRRAPVNDLPVAVLIAEPLPP
jgi:hypothetical protein